jgi:hypothetical protein
MTGFDFNSIDPFEPNRDDLLPAGEYVVTIASAENSDTQNGNPQIEVEVGNDLGTRKDWIVYGSASDTNGFGLRHVVGLFASAGVELKDADAKMEDNGQGGQRPRMTDAALKKLVGKKVGVVIKDEPAYDKATKRPDPSKLVPRVQGYLKPDKVDTAKQPEPVAAGGGQPVKDEDIPF